MPFVAHYIAPRRLKRQQVLSLGTCAWIQQRHNLVVTGPTGIGKSYLACAFVERVCRKSRIGQLVPVQSASVYNGGT